MADEAGFLELLVANERVGRWLDTLMDPYQRSRHKYAIAQLHQDLHKGAAYVEEAARQGVTQVLTKLLSQTRHVCILPQAYAAERPPATVPVLQCYLLLSPLPPPTDPCVQDLRACEKTMDAISRIIAQCSGPMACGGKVSSFQYGDIEIMLQEGALGDGLGAKVWSVCHIMCRELVSHPEIYQDQVVLELGSGTGLVGLVAALAGAQQVILTDYEDQVLTNLRTCMHMNSRAVQAEAADRLQQQSAMPSSSAAAPGAQSHAIDEIFASGTDDDEAGQQQQQQGCDITEKELFDDAKSVEELDLSAMLGDAGGTAADRAQGSAADPAAATAEIARSCVAWEADNMCVRHLDWQESADALAAAAAAEAHPQAAGTEGDEATSCSKAPGVSPNQQYPVILGNEVMYELQHAQLVAAAIKHRLQPGGRALLCCAVRDQKVFNTFRDSCQYWGLRYRTVRVRPERDEDLGGIQGRERDYEGGYLLMAVDHASAPATDWHRDDFTEVV